MNAVQSNMIVTMPSDTEISMTREFDAPRALVYDAYTKCEHLARWWGVGNGATLAECEMDLKPGGRWRRVVRSKEGYETPFEGVYSEVVPPEKLSYTMTMGAEPNKVEVFETILIQDSNGKTSVTTIAKCPSKEWRDQMAPYVQAGASAAYDALEQLLESLK